MSTQEQKKTDHNFVSERGRQKAEIVNPDYQPSVAELEEGRRLVVTFGGGDQALAKPVRVKSTGTVF
ncbi:MAG: hypothetical protein OXC38_03920 [Gammaproteobacteria bacterium]|nr:hypothetical protein [Gammaproteobacteria bacterium]